MYGAVTCQEFKCQVLVAETLSVIQDMFKYVKDHLIKCKNDQSHAEVDHGNT